MGDFRQIQKAAEGLIALCEKEKLARTDKEKMLLLHADIFTGIEKLSECEFCGAISDVIATITLTAVTAKLCKACGVKALEAGKIQSPTKRVSRKQTRRAKIAKTASPSKPPAKKSENLAALHVRVEEQTGIKKADVKRLHKILTDIATPMNREHTLTYVQREVDIAKLKVEADTLEKAVEILMAPR